MRITYESEHFFIFTFTIPNVIIQIPLTQVSYTGVVELSKKVVIFSIALLKLTKI
jgi:hypothetical protein